MSTVSNEEVNLNMSDGPTPESSRSSSPQVELEAASNDGESDHEHSGANEVEATPPPKKSEAKSSTLAKAPVASKAASAKKTTAAATTPASAKRKAKTAVKKETGEGGADEEEVKATPKGSAKKRKTASGPGDGVVVPIPTSYESSSAADKELIRMKDAGEAWATIKVKWEELSGVKVSAGTLPNRYIRLRANMTQFTDADDLALRITKKEIEETFEREKWSMVSDAMAKKGHIGFPAASLSKRFRQLE